LRVECFCCSISFWFKQYCESGIRVYYHKHSNYHVKEMNAEIRELNRMICKNCDAKDYNECEKCKIYQLINQIAQ